ncbi:LuxR C-terminal-related transcriptional regulator [Kitasatospora sp. NPDC048298]|uniref:LuxR C-terminal-related transcriptional regulator n=1 Tax=Kitasatospora sp. NPDC048298 TaxID=3364049 RepID=UPI003714629C
MTTPPTADSPTPERHRKPARAGTDAGRPPRELTPREVQVLAHLAAGHDLPRTAVALGVTPATARSYLQRALRKLGTRTEAEALALLADALPRPEEPAPACGAGRPSADVATGGDAPMKRRRSRAGKPTPRTSDDARKAARPARDADGGAARRAPAEKPRQASGRPPAPAKSAAPGRAHEGRAPGGQASGATVPRAPLAAPATVGARRQPTAGNHEPAGRADGGGGPTLPAAPGRHGGAPGAEQARARGADGGRGPTTPTDPGAEQDRPENVPTSSGRPSPGNGNDSGDGRGPQAPADTAALPGDTSRRAPAAQGSDGRKPQAAEPDQAREAPTEHAGRGATAGRRADGGRSKAAGPDRASDATATPTARLHDPAEPRRATSPSTGPGPNTPTGGTAADRGEHPYSAAAPAGPGSASPGRVALAAAPSVGDDDLDAEPPAVSFEELYETAHTRLVQQVFLLTACRHRAVHCVRLAFGEARRRWGAVAASGNPEGWVRARACELALSPWHRGGPRRSHVWALPHRRIRVRPADEAQAVLPDHDRLTDRDRALLKALKRLSRPQRRALVLHDGLGLPAPAVAVEMESTRVAAEGRVWAARAALAQWTPELVGPDPAAPGFADGLSGQLYRAAVRGCPQPHRAPVPVLRARHRLWTASRTGAAALLTFAVAGATLATLSGVRPAVLFRSVDPPAPAVCLPAALSAGAQEAEPSVPLLPGGVPNGITSYWCSPAPGLEAVLVEPQPRAAARWELPAAGRAAAPPPQGPAVCRLWSPLPCTTGPGAH